MLESVGTNRVWVMVFTFEHVQHSLGDQKSTRNVHKCQQDRQSSENLWKGMWEIPSSHDKQASDSYDTTDSIRLERNGVSF